MNNTAVASYAELLDSIDRRSADGSISTGRATVERLLLTAEIHERIRPLWQKALIVLFWFSLAVSLVGVAVQIFTIATMGGTISMFGR